MLNKFIWKDEYGVGIQLIDEQHKHFFEIVNKILDLADNKFSAKEELSAIINELGNYAMYHLGTEEEYFDIFKYPDAVIHIDRHNKYREIIKKYMDRVQNEKNDVKKLTEEVASYSGSWLSNHILEVDKKYTKFFNEHGLK